MPMLYFISDEEMQALKKPMDAETLLRRLGATGKLNGFPYAIFMIEAVVEDASRLQLITKRLYPDTAHQFGVSAASVERDLRTLIHSCWNKTDHSFLTYLAGATLQRPPTNSEFLDLAASYLRRTGEKQG